MLIIGLTGGIACGKTTATEHFRSLGVPVIDADEISHELTTPGSAAVRKIVQQFGADLVNEQGELDRAALRHDVFSDADRRRQLENILHPGIIRIIRQRIAELEAAYCIVSIPLLTEKKLQNLVDRVLLIDTPVDLQIARLRQRNAFTDSEIQAILASQATREQRLHIADDIIVNDSSLEDFIQALNKQHRSYLQASSRSRA